MSVPRIPVSPVALLVAAMTLLVLVSLPALEGPLVLDSVKLYVLEAVAVDHGAAAVLHTPALGEGLGGYNRIVSMASFVLNIQLAGQMSPFALKVVNVGIHLAGGALVFVLTRMLMTTTVHADRAVLVAAFTGALWLLSPTNFNVALYAVQRMAQLSALFTLAGLVFYTAGRLHDDRFRGGLYITLAVVCLPLAVLSKQNGILLVPLAFIVEIYFLNPARPRWTARQLVYAGIAGGVIGVALLFYVYPGVLNYQHRDFTLAERLLSQPRALLAYLRHIVAPHGSDAGIYSDDFTASESLLSPPATTLALVGLAALAGCCVFRTGVFGYAAFGAAFFLVAHTVESTILPLELYFLHRNYLPSYGIYLALSCLLVFGLPDRKWVIAALAIYLSYSTAISYARSLTWSSRANIAAASVHYHPDSPRALADYAQTALEQGDYDLSLAAIDRSLALTDSPAARLQRLYVLCRAGAPVPAKALSRLGQSSRFGTGIELSQAQDNLLRLYRDGGCEQLDVTRLVDSLDALAARYRGRGRNPWTIDYYAVSFLYAGGFEPAAHERLQQRLDRGHLESGLYRLELLIREDAHAPAAALLDQIETRFGEARLDRYRVAFEALRKEVNRMR